MTAPSLATLNGQIVTSCRVQVPAWGAWWAEVECGSGDVLKGAAMLVLDDVTFLGTIVTGGSYQTRTRYRIVGGAGGWGKTIPATSYANDLGVKLATVLTDAARACGEKMGPIPSTTIGPAFARASEQAARVLEELVPRGWYVDEAGVTQIGRRPAVAFTGPATRITEDTAQGRIELAPAAIAGLVPGAIVDGIEAVDVEHVLGGADGSLRTTIWGRSIADTSRLSEALRRIVEAFTSSSRFHASWEYRVVQQNGDRLDLQSVRVSSGMPDLRAVPMRPSLLGENVTFTPGALCLVSFINGDPTRPIVDGGDYQHPPILSKLAGGGPFIARVGDGIAIYAKVMMIAAQQVIALGPSSGPVIAVTAAGLGAIAVPGGTPWGGGQTAVPGVITDGSAKVECG